MALTITPDLITSDRSPHSARRLGSHQYLFQVSWMPLYPVGRTAAVAAMKIADIVGDGTEPVQMTEIESLAHLIGIRGATAVEQVIEPPDQCELKMITQPDTLDGMTLHDALSQAWLSIRKEVPDVPDATVSVGRGRLHVTDWEHAVVEVPSSTVPMGGLAIMDFLLHQAAHSLDRVAYAGAAGRYHGEGYRAAAERLGLDVRKAKGLGWANTSVTPELAELYAAPIAALDSGRVGFQDPGPKQHSRQVTVICACPRRMSVVPSVFYRGGVVCEICGQPFREPERAAER